MSRAFLFIAALTALVTTARAGDDAGAWRDRAFADLAAGHYGQAISDADAGLAAYPETASLLTLRAAARLRSGDARGALADADAAVRRDANEALAWQQRGLARRALGQAPDVYLADLAQAARLDSSLAPAYLQASRAALPWWARPAALTVGAAGVLLLVGFGAALLRTRDRRGERDVVGGCFRLKRLIGAGGMGTVYEAWDSNLERAVAIKRMSPALRDDPEEARRFVEEAKTVAALKHLNIVAIHYAFQDGGELYLVFELVRGRTLAEHVESKGGRLDWPQALALLEPIAAALDYAHARGVIHRDLKPANVMLEDGAVKVMDFGIARRTRDPDARTMTSQIAGTPGYMAPELQRGEVSRACDVYSLAVCAHWVTAGGLPSTGSFDAARGPAAVLARALDADPRRRPASAGELVESLRAACRA